MTLLDALAPIVDVVFPPRCPLCGAGINSQTGLCMACWNTLAIPGDPACVSCGRPFGDAMKNGGTCAPCFADPPLHDGIAAATLYNEASRNLILSFKHGNKITLAPMMAQLISSKLSFIDRDWLIIPVPLHRWRLWKRGYNQAAELAREISKLKQSQLCVDGLLRTKKTVSLGGLGRHQRKRALAGAITVHPKHKAWLHKANIVLVDDVLTSGATSNACITALKRAGANKVVVACFARVLDEALHLT